jgi:hypothetical protein
MEWPSWLILAYTGRRAPRRRGRDRGCPVSGWGQAAPATPWRGSRLRGAGRVLMQRRHRHTDTAISPNGQALDGGAYARRYRDREQTNESGHGRAAGGCIGCGARRDRSTALDAGVREHQPQPAHDRGGGHQGPPGARQPPRRGAAQLSYPGHTWGTHGRLLEMTRCVRQWGFPLVPFRTARGRGARWPRVGRAVDAPSAWPGEPVRPAPHRSRAPRHLQLLWDARTARPVYPWWRWRLMMAATSSALTP